MISVAGMVHAGRLPITNRNKRASEHFRVAGNLSGTIRNLGHHFPHRRFWTGGLDCRINEADRTQNRLQAGIKIDDNTSKRLGVGALV
jgi:hypothetical protein